MKKYSQPARHKFIQEQLKDQGTIDVNRLTDELGVSEMTIRRDLAFLENQKLLIRTYGGASQIPTRITEGPLGNRLMQQRDEKLKIARRAAELVEDGDIIAMDASSTVWYMVEYLMNRSITVITNNVSTALALSKSYTVQVILLGGNLKKDSHYVYGYDEQEMMGRYHINKLFFSSAALDIGFGLSDTHVHGAASKRQMMRNADQSILLMDHTKLGQRSFYQVCPLEELQWLLIDEVKDGRIAEQIHKACLNAGIRWESCP